MTKKFDTTTHEGPLDLNLNVSAFRIIYIFKLLTQHEVISLDELNNCLMDHPLINRAFTTETLKKYLQTLGMIGCEVSRSATPAGTCYCLKEHPLKLEFSIDEIKAVREAFAILYTQPLKSDYDMFYQFVRRISAATKSTECYPSAIMNLTQDSPLSAELKERISCFEKYCFDAQLIEFSYVPPDDAPQESLVIEPIELSFQHGQILLIGCNPETNKKVRYKLHHITEHKQLPSRTRMQALHTTVTFKLCGRLAKTYRPYPGEIILDQQDSLLVKHKTDDTDLLLHRLLKYGVHCEVLSPDSVRQDIVTLMEQHAQSLQQPIEADLLDALTSKARTNETLHKWLRYLDTPQTSGVSTGGSHH